jgi:molecular chaperone HscA
VALREHDSSSLVPSILYFNGENEILVGDLAKEHLVSDPQRTIFSVKRLMGKSYNDIRTKASFFTYKVIDDDTERLVKIQVGPRFYSPVELSSFILKELKTRAEHILKTPVNKAVITVPAYFNDAQRQATRDAGKLAGLDVLRIINEPTAASLAYGLGLQKDQNKKIAVYDLGGGTFDISILSISNGIFEVLSTNGDTYLGGDDLDHTLAEYILKEAGIDTKKIEEDKNLAQEIRLKAESIKKQLSETEQIEIHLADKGFVISRETLNGLMKPYIDKTMACCSAAMKDAGFQPDQIDEVILVGGSTRIPAVRKAVTDFFGRKPHDEINPDEAVALGAAIQADILAGKNKDFLLLDITPLSLGIETMGGLMDVLIPRNSKVPTRAARQYTTQKDGQLGIRISVFQGERDLVKDNRKLAEFNLNGIPAMPAGLPKVEISFLINADGIMVVKARELRSGTEQEVEVKPQYGLTDQEVETMLLDSITHAKEDMTSRALLEAITEAEQMIEATEKFVGKNEEYLEKVELKNTQDGVEQLRQSIRSKDKDQIHKNIEILNEISRPYAERLMDLAIGKAMKGKKV